ncbi:MAG: sigma-70 family RNA polymerase sigma factor [Phycisphaeraceae bacterium]|nr:sigma-70 family RNA polymerase sigma factor [Phycisphaeraceae bacterium]
MTAQRDGRNPDSPSDEQLLGQYRHHGPDADTAFEQLVLRYRQELFHFLLRFTGQRAAADDLFQETFLQVHLSAESFDATRRFKPWLFTIAANKARDMLRRNRRQSALSLSAELGGSGDDTASFIDLLEADLPLPGEQVLDNEQQELVRAVVDSLPDHMREVLILAYFNKLPYRDIAEMLSIPLGTVKSRLHAAVATFADLWAARSVEGSD